MESLIWQRKGLGGIGHSCIHVRLLEFERTYDSSEVFRSTSWVLDHCVLGGSGRIVWQQNGLAVADCLVRAFKVWSRDLPTIPRFDPGLGRGYMEYKKPGKSAEREALEGALHNWFQEQGVSVEGAIRAVRLLDSSVLLAQPQPSRWNRKGDFGVQERCRYLWYRHAARILGWCERRRFPAIVTDILRGHAFPQHGGRDEAAREEVKGSVSAGSRAGPLAINSAEHCSGQSVLGVDVLSPGFWAVNLFSILFTRVRFVRVR
jgi:hypothetical protein